MKKTRKLIALLIVMALFALTPLTAMALPSGGYVGTKVKYYYKDGSKWKLSEECTRSFKSDGRLTKIKWKNPESKSTGSTSYQWSGNFLKKVKYTYDSSTYKYKGNKLVSSTYTYGKNKSTTKYKWKKNKAVLKYDYGTTTYYMNSRGQITKIVYKNKESSEKSTTTYKYYASGNLKSYKYKSGKYSTSVSYNSKGYITKSSNKDTGYSSTTKYKYKIKNGKITEVKYTRKDGKETYSYKAKFTKWKWVSHVRNCDATGGMHTISLF